MADNGRWFKVWTSIIGDPDFSGMTLEDVGRWTRLGALTKLSGDRGVLSIRPEQLAKLLEVPPEAVGDTLSRLPNVYIVSNDAPLRGQNPVNGKVTVTWRNWRKYQEDSTVAARVRGLRSKKRREEKRERTPVVTREETASDAAPDSSGDSEGLSSLWESGTGHGHGRTGIEGRAGPGPPDSVARVRALLRDPEHMRRFLAKAGRARSHA